MKNTVGKIELVKEVGLQTGVARQTVSEVFDAIFATIIEEMSQGNEVSVKNFGTFTLNHVDATEWLSKLTNETYKTPAHNTPRFKASLWMKTQIRNGSTEE
jgi:nucleoid DNA-binding protein|nr:MAG TPA: Bacterial DNA-binding protein [Caudoviricetes sp.]